MTTGFKAGDLVRFKEDSWWLNRSAGFRKGAGSAGFREKYNAASLVLVTDDIIESERFFYGIICGGDGEAHLWSSDQFNLVQAGAQ